MTNDPTTPKETPSRLAYWAAACPKWGLLLFGLGLLAQWALWPLAADAPVIGGFTALGLGGALGLGLGLLILRRKPAPSARKRAFAGILWGSVNLTAICLLGGCALILNAIQNQVHRNYEVLKCQTMQQHELAFYAAHPDQPVTLRALLDNPSMFPPIPLSFYGETPDNTRIQTPFILVPGFQQPPRAKAIAVFVDPEIPVCKKRGEVPVAYEDGSTAFLPITELEKALKQQTDLTIAEIIRQQRTP